MTVWIKRVLLLTVCLTMTACVSEMGLREEFEKSMRAYNRMLRWQEVENAGMTYVDKEQRDEFMRNAESLRRRGVTLTDFRILTFECLPDKKTGDVVAEFDYFILPSNRIKTVTYRQEWVYRDLLKSWKLKSGLPPFE
ncbi:MAG: hypothetical protein A2X82_14050 [Geobacteraceae bacterium GWC2_55_20]|nr:MAG: hypothetical protein A2X82_14050 [Geobacteraceae bacterium GWC2_55_20]HCE66102.1 hypothetical protein [Geobacter sp.]